MSGNDNNNNAAPSAVQAGNDDNGSQHTGNNGSHHTGNNNDANGSHHSTRSGNDNNNNNNNNGPIVLPKELPVGLLLIVNLTTFAIGIVTLILLFNGIANGYIVGVDSPNVVLTDPALEKPMIQTMTNGMIHLFIATLLIGVIANGLNIAELYFPAVVAKHRVKQLVLNRIASGLALGNWIITLSSLPSYIGRKRSITAGSSSMAGYDSNLAFWILLFVLAPFMALSHRLTPNENKRRFDRAGSFDDEEMSPFTNNAPDN